jgi:hypothetical protein
VCTNGYDNDAEEMMFDHLSGCCEYAEFDNGQCYYDDVCADTNDKPTPFPSENSTPLPPTPTPPTPTPPTPTVDTPEPTNELIPQTPTTPVPSLPEIQVSTYAPTTLTLITPKPTPVCTGCPVPPNPVPVPPTPVTSPSPTVCTDQLIYWDGVQCTRGPPMGGNKPDNIDDLIMFETYDECCLTYVLMYSDECPMYDGCNPPVPSGDTPPPSPGIEVLTYPPSFGSTPTISKETTGPPTLSRN